MHKITPHGNALELSDLTHFGIQQHVKSSVCMHVLLLSGEYLNIKAHQQDFNSCYRAAISNVLSC